MFLRFNTRKKDGKAHRIWIMDRGIPTEETLKEMRHSDPPVSYRVGTPRARCTTWPVSRRTPLSSASGPHRKRSGNGSVTKRTGLCFRRWTRGRGYASSWRNANRSIGRPTSW